MRWRADALVRGGGVLCGGLVRDDEVLVRRVDLVLVVRLARELPVPFFFYIRKKILEGPADTGGDRTQVGPNNG